MTDTTPIKVLIVMQSSGLHNGVAQVLLKLLPFLQQQQIIPHVALPEHGPLESQLNANHIATTVIPAEVFFGKHPENLYCYIEQLPERAKSLAHYIRQNNIDVVHTNTFLHFDGALAARWSNRPHIWGLHGIYGKARESGVFRMPELSTEEKSSFLDLTCEQFFTVSNACRESLLRNHINKPIQTIYNGINIEEFDTRAGDITATHNLRNVLELPPETAIVATVGRIHPDKDQMTFVNAAALIHEQRPDVHFVLIGPTDNQNLAQQLKHRVAALGLAEQFHFMGRFHEIEGLYSQFDIFMLTSLHEGLSNVCLEAMAAECPVISTRAGGVSEILDNDDYGILTELHDAKMLAKFACELLANPVRRDTMGRNSRERVESAFTWNMIAPQYRHAYDRVIEQYQQPNNSELQEIDHFLAKVYEIARENRQQYIRQFSMAEPRGGLLRKVLKKCYHLISSNNNQNQGNSD